MTTISIHNLLIHLDAPRRLYFHLQDKWIYTRFMTPEWHVQAHFWRDIGLRDIDQDDHQDKIDTKGDN